MGESFWLSVLANNINTKWFVDNILLMYVSITKKESPNRLIDNY